MLRDLGNRASLTSEPANVLRPNFTTFDERSEAEEELRTWALNHNITHTALKDLLQLIKVQYCDKTLPLDPRTLLDTPQNTGKSCSTIAGGKYWHHGIKRCLIKWFGNLSDNINISININIDGLPIYKSSKFQLWPILCNVYEFPKLQALPVGIFFGKGKPGDVKEFLTPFVDEIIPIMEEGFLLNHHVVTLKLRCFICDSPARAFVKGKLPELFHYFQNNNFSYKIIFRYYATFNLRSGRGSHYRISTRDKAILIAFSC